MLLPHSMDYLINGGVLDFDAASYLNGNGINSCNYNTNMLGNVYTKKQPQADSFDSEKNKKQEKINTIKKVVTALTVTALACVGFSKGKKCIDMITGFFKKWNLADTTNKAVKFVNVGLLK